MGPHMLCERWGSPVSRLLMMQHLRVTAQRSDLTLVHTGLLGVSGLNSPHLKGSQPTQGHHGPLLSRMGQCLLSDSQVGSNRNLPSELTKAALRWGAPCRPWGTFWAECEGREGNRR